MKVAIDLLAYVPGSTGATAYWRKLLDALPGLDGEMQYYVFVTPLHEQYYRRGRQRQHRNLHFVPVHYPARSIPRRLYCQEVSIPRFCNREHVDVHFTSSPVPVLSRMVAAEVWIVFGLQYFYAPLQTTLSKAAYWRLAMRAKAARASITIANSHDTATNLQRLLQIPSSKLVTVYEAIDHSLFHPAQVDEGFLRTKGSELGIRRPYVLNVSDNRPYKRQRELIRAFARICWGDVARNHQLVIVGRDYLGYRSALMREARALRIGERVVFVDHLPVDWLPQLYRAADLFVYPSTLETFGKPPLEAMACGVPVITSDRSAVSEISAPGSLAVDPQDECSLAAAMEKILGDPAYNSRLVARGVHWARRYQDSEHAQRLLSLLQEAGSREHDEARARPSAVGGTTCA